MGIGAPAKWGSTGAVLSLTCHMPPSGKNPAYSWPGVESGCPLDAWVLADFCLLLPLFTLTT